MYQMYRCNTMVRQRNQEARGDGSQGSTEGQASLAAGHPMSGYFKTDMK